MNDNEIWKSINDFEELYQVSNKGRIRNASKKILKTALNHNGYVTVYLSKHSKKYVKRVHRLVAEAFIANPDNKVQVNHIDGNKQNNNILNLEWCDASENIRHAYKNNLFEKQREMAKKKLSEHATAREVNQIDLNGNFIKKWGCIKEAGIFFGRERPTAIVSCCKGRLNTAYGFKWEYV